MIKLSELNFDKSLDVLGALSIEINEIMQDKKLMENLSKQIVVKEKLTETEKNALYTRIAVQKIVLILPMIIKDHKQNVLNVVSIMREEPLEVVKELPLKEVIFTFKELAKDKDFLDLFKLTA